MTAAPLPACPFCGADGEDLRVLPPNCTPQSPYSLADRAYPVLRCGGCGASVPGEDWDTLGASAVAAWNRRAPEAQAWRAIETAPRDGSVILLLRGAQVVPAVWRDDEPLCASFPWVFLDHGVVDAREDGECHGLLNGFHATGEYAPTHWQPLPAPPGATPAPPPADAAMREALEQTALDAEVAACNAARLAWIGEWPSAAYPPTPTTSFEAGWSARAALAAADAAMREALREIAAERQRQMAVEGWTPEHDDEHRGGEIAWAAACYAAPEAVSYTDTFGRALDPNGKSYPLPTGRRRQSFSYVRALRWPWDHAWWKPKDRRRNLVRAGALIVAEIERLDRAALAAADGLRDE